MPNSVSSKLLQTGKRNSSGTVPRLSIGGRFGYFVISQFSVPAKNS